MIWGPTDLHPLVADGPIRYYVDKRQRWLGFKAVRLSGGHEMSPSNQRACKDFERFPTGDLDADIDISRCSRSGNAVDMFEHYVAGESSHNEKRNAQLIGNVRDVLQYCYDFRVNPAGNISQDVVHRESSRFPWFVGRPRRLDRHKSEKGARCRLHRSLDLFARSD